MASTTTSKTRTQPNKKSASRKAASPSAGAKRKRPTRKAGKRASAPQTEKVEQAAKTASQSLARKTRSPRRESHLTKLGAYGFESLETVLLAALVTEDPILLIGRSGTGKTFLLNTLSEALGLEHRHYNASLVSFDDLVGFPYPDEEKSAIRFLETPATIWEAESVLVDEISRCKPEHQNRFFSLVHERKVQGIPLPKLRFRWAAMNPASVDQTGQGSYSGSEPLDAALADRFAIIVGVGDWLDLSEADRARVADPSSEGRIADDGGRLAGRLAGWRRDFEERVAACPEPFVQYASAATTALVGAGVRVSPRRARLLSRTLLAASIVRGEVDEKVCRQVLSVSLPQVAWDEQVPAERVKAAHRVAWGSSFLGDREKWLFRFEAEPRLDRKLSLLVEVCPDPDAGTLAVEQLLGHESKERSAAFAFATFSAAVAGALPIGAEAVSDLAQTAQDLVEVSGEIVWAEPSGARTPTDHPEHSRLGRVLSALSGAREDRARQLLNWCLLNKVVPSDPAAFEQEFDACVEIARKAVEAYEAAAAGEESS